MPEKMQTVSLRVNGKDYEFSCEPNVTLLQIIRDRIGLTGTKSGCDFGECGACTVLMDGDPVLSCLILAAEAHGAEITTIEGLSSGEALHPIQRAFIEQGAIQCGYCTPAMILSAKSLLDRNENPSEEEVREAIAGNLCRCTGYVKIVKAILAASHERH